MPKDNKLSGAHSQFLIQHEVQYGLRIMHRDPTTSKVISVRCEFCIYFGRQIIENQPQLRAQKTTIKTWMANFRTDLYLLHHRAQHSSIWNQYQRSTEIKKTKFFQQPRAIKDTILQHMPSQSTAIQYHINSDIVDVLICDMFFHPDNHDSVSQVAVKKLFGTRHKNGLYSVVISNVTQFQLVVSHIAAGISFRQAVVIHNSYRTIAGISSDLDVANCRFGSTWQSS